MAIEPKNYDMFADIAGMPDDDEDVASSSQGVTEGQADEGGTHQQASERTEQATQEAPAQHESQQQPPTQTGDPAGTQSTPDGTATQNEAVRPDGLVARADPNTPGLMNLVDPRTGQIVVPGGPAQRFYNQAMQARAQATTLNNELSAVKTQLDAYKAAFDANNTYKLEPVQVDSALRIMADFQKDPITTLQRIMGEMQQAGVDLSPIMQGGAQFAPQVIEGVIERKFGPMLQQQQAQANQEAQIANARKELDSFIATTDYGAVHLDTIRELLSRDGTLTLQAAYLKIAEFAANNGFRMDQSIEQQIAARRQQQATATGAQPRPQGITTAQAPLPNARNMSAGVQQGEDAESVNAQFSHDMTWDAIARQAMRDHGL